MEGGEGREGLWCRAWARSSGSSIILVLGSRVAVVFCIKFFTNAE